VRPLLRVRAAAHRLPAGAVRLGLLCLSIVVIGMIRPRLTHDAAGWLLLAAGLLTAAGAASFSVATRRTASRLPLMAGSLRIVDAVLVLLRRTGLPFLGLAFFLFWTFVYVGLWWYHPQETFTGLAERPRFADFFYYAVSSAFIAPPQDIVAASRGARSATMIEMLTGLALLTTYVSSLFQWRRREGAAEREADPPVGPPGGQA
jgi:hypothetical protein